MIRKDNSTPETAPLVTPVETTPGGYEPPALKDWGPIERMTLAGGGANPDASTTTGSAGGGLT